MASRLRELAARSFTAGAVGLRDELLLPLPAALVELSALYMRSTPLDRLTAVHDTLSQIETHVRLAFRSVKRKPLGDGELRSAHFFPSAREEVLLLLGVLVNARPDHLASSLAYMRYFAFSAPPHMRDSLAVLVEAAGLAERLQMERIPWRRLETDLRLEDLVRIAESLRRPSLEEAAVAEVDGGQRSGRLEAHWRGVIARLELCSMELTRVQEKSWSRLGGAGAVGWRRRDAAGRDRLMLLLTLLHNKLLCNSDNIRDNG
jgi:hypothetical protein